MEELSYMLVYLLCFLGFVGLHSAVANPGGWLNTGLSLLFCYNIIQVLLVVGLSVVPGRLLRNLAELELALNPLTNLFVSRLEVYKYMAAKKDITIRVEDLAHVSEYYSKADGHDHDHGDAVMALNNCDDDQFALKTNHANHASSEGTVVLYIDKFRVEQILRNLVSNAIKFTPNNGTITIRFTIISTSTAAASANAAGSPPKLLDQPILKLEDESVEKQIHSYLRIEVVDNGAGIALENQFRVFQEFVQFNRNKLQGGGGSGLGLWICKNLATMHGGGMHFHSGGEGQGSTFYVDLPVFKRNRSDPVIEVPLVGSAAVDLNNDSPSAIRRSISFTSSAAAPTAPTAAVDGDTDDNNAVAVAAAAAAAADIEMGVKSLRVLVVDDSSAN
eukprot:gene31255-40623_t